MYIIKVARSVGLYCYLGDHDKFVDDPKEAHKWKYKREAMDHACSWSLFHQWCDNSSIDVKVLKFKRTETVEIRGSND
jgi:hypothetical protein